MKKNLTLSIVTAGFLAASGFSMPAFAQRVADVDPALESEGVTPDSSISGLFEATAGESVDPSTVRIFVNDAEVTSQSTITASFFSYKPAQPLPPGENSVRLSYQGGDGQTRTVSWSFDVAQPRQALEIGSVNHNAASEALGAGATFLATINGTAGANASVLLVAGSQVREVPAQEVSPGVYVATLAVGQGDNFDRGAVLGRLESGGDVLNFAAPQPVRFSGATAAAAGPEVQQDAARNSAEQPESVEAGEALPLRPSFISHNGGDAVTGNFKLIGQTQPNATVEIDASASRSALGGFISVGDDSLVDTLVRADDMGRFEVQIPGAATGSGTRYSIRAVAEKDGTRSEATQITLVAQ